MIGPHAGSPSDQAATPAGRHEAPAALGSEDDYRSFVDLNPQVPWIASPAGEILDVNQRWLDLTGLTRDATLGSGWADVAHPEDIDAMRAAWARVATTGEPYDVEHRMRTADGSYRWMRTRANARRGPDGSVRRWYGYTEDIEDRKRLEQLLQAQERRTNEKLAELEAIYRTAPIGLAVLDADLRFTRINERLAQINGHSVAEHLGRTVREMVPDLSAEGEQALRHVLETGEPMKNLELVGETRADPGVPHTWLEQWSAIRDPDGRIRGISVVTEDITEFKRMERELREADHSKDRFLAMLAHELRNPLSPLAAALDLLGRHRSLDERDAKLVAIATRQVGHLKRLVTDLLDVARIIRGEINMCYERVQLESIVRQAAESVEPDMTRSGHRFSVVLPTQPVELVADPVRLAQILGNLLSNACKYTPAPGQVRLEAEAMPECVQFKVIDDGIGIEKQNLGVVFKLFMQVQAPGDKGTLQGLGIGLALVKQLVGLHGGTVRAESEGKGRGACFTVQLPYEPAPARPAAADPATGG